MTLENAIITAGEVAKRVDHPGYVYHETYQGGVPLFQVACVEWQYLTEVQREGLHTIVTPDGGVFEYQREVPA